MARTHSTIPKTQRESLEMKSVADALPSDSVEHEAALLEANKKGEGDHAGAGVELEEKSKKEDRTGDTNDKNSGPLNKENTPEQESKSEKEVRDAVEESASPTAMKWHNLAKARQYAIHMKLPDIQQFIGLSKKPSKIEDLGNDFTPEQKEQYEQWLKGPRQDRGWMSSRMDRLVEGVNHVRSSDSACKIVIVDDSVFALDIVQIALNDTDKMLDVFRLDGRTGSAEAIHIAREFASATPPAVILVSKVGLGFKSTLNMANVVIILSPMWKLSDEEQAISRVHCIGQTRAVSLYKLHAENSKVDNYICSRPGRK